MITSHKRPHALRRFNGEYTMFRKILLLVGALVLLIGCKKSMDMKDTTQLTDTTTSPSLAENAPKATQLVKLSNGLTVLIKQDDRFPLVNARLMVHAGSGYETPETAGISHLLEHMVFKGTDKRAVGESARDIESVGGSMNAATSFDYTVYYVEVPDTEWKLGLDVITDMAFHATIDPHELTSERKVVLEELERGEDTPSSKLFKTLQGMIWKGTSYEWPIIGFRDTVEGFTDEDIHQYINEFYQPQSMLLSVVGKVDPAQIIAEAERLLGNRKNTQATIPPKPFAIPESSQGPHIVKLPGQWNKVYLGAAFPIPQSASAKIPGLELLTQLLGGDDTSRFYRKFKYEKQLVDSISVAPLTLERGGMLYIHATLDAQNVQQFWTELMAELASFDATQFTDQEIDRARLNIEDSLFLTKETLSGLASKTAYFQFLEGGEQAEENFLFEMGQIDQAQLKSLYDEFIRPDQLSTAILVPESSDIATETLVAITNDKWPATADTKTTQTTQESGEQQEITLPGGSKLVLLPDATLPYTAMSIYWTGGDGELTPEQQGLASLTAKALTRGNMQMSATEVQDFLSDRAASLGSSAGRNIFAVESKFPTRFTDEMLPFLRTALSAPAFDQAEVTRAKQDQIAGIKRREDQPLGLAFRHLFPFLFKTGPYAMLHQGTPKEVEALEQDDIMRFWGRQSMQPFTIAVCGQFDTATITQFATDIATTLTAPGTTYEFTTPEWNSEHEMTMQLPDRNQSHLLMIFPTPGKTDRQASAQLELLKAALAGQSGLLFRDLREKQALAYTVTSMLWQSRNTGFMALYIGTSPDKVDQSLDGFHKVLAELATSKLPEAELARARNILVGDYYQEHQSLISRSRQAASLLTRGFDLNYEQDVIEQAKSVTPEEIQELVKQYLDPDKAYILKVTP